MFRLRSAIIGIGLIVNTSVAAQTTATNARLPIPKEAIGIGGFSFLDGSVLRGEQLVRIVDFLSYPDRAAPLPDGRVNRIYVARTYTTPAEIGGDPFVKWADARACPKLYGVLSGFNALEAPRFFIPNLFGLPPVGAGIRPALPVSTEARVYSVWGRATQADGAVAHMRIEAHNGLVADWVMFAEDRLSDCWTEQQPVIPNR